MHIEANPMRAFSSWETSGVETRSRRNLKISYTSILERDRGSVIAPDSAALRSTGPSFARPGFSRNNNG